jgi:3-oxoadipate enol-lactonase
MILPQLTILGSGQPFVWLHGMLGSVESDSVYSLVDFSQVSEISSVIRYDACGQSVTGDYSWNAMTDELFSLANQRNFGPMILGGTSMGSGTAIHFAIRYPEKVKALILVTPPPAWEMRMGVKALYEKIALKADQNGLPEFLKKLIGQNQDPPEFFEEKHPGTRQRLLEYRLGFQPAYYASIYRGGAASDLPSRELLDQIKVPTLIATFQDDINHPLEMSRQLNKLIAGSEMVVISDYDEFLKFQEKANNLVCLTFNDNKS